MANYHEIFKEKNAVLPVIHITGPNQATRNAEIAQEAGADGVFLISMEGEDHRYLNKIHELVKKELPSFWIGMNYLDLINNPIEVFTKVNPDISGVWLDDAEINSANGPQLEALKIVQARKASGWDGLYFGGVAFKYRGRVAEEDLLGVAKIATNFMDVVTTSGDGTGKPPEVSKIEIMKAGVGKHPLAIASGISADNIYRYLEIADAFLVATSLLKPYTEDFDPQRVKALVEAARNK
jgi:uncharacterized protein